MSDKRVELVKNLRGWSLADGWPIGAQYMSDAADLIEQDGRELAARAAQVQRPPVEQADVMRLADETPLPPHLTVVSIAGGNQTVWGSWSLREFARTVLRAALAHRPQEQQADRDAVLEPAYTALDRIAEDPNDMTRRREAEVSCFYAVQRYRALKGETR